MDRPWNLDAIPLLISPNEWRELEAGLIQRARLLNWILADLYGPQKLLRGGHLPPAVVFANPGFLRPCHALPVPDNAFLHLLAVDLARSADGQWWVLSRSHPGAFRRGIRAREPHRAGGDVSGSVPRIPGAASGVVLPIVPQQHAAAVDLDARAIRAWCC